MTNELYVVTPHCWDSIVGDIIIFSTPEKARTYITKEQKKNSNIQFSIEARWVDQPHKRKHVKTADTEWKEQY